MSFCTRAPDHKSGRAATERWPTAKTVTYSESAQEFASNGIFGGGLRCRAARQLRSGALRGGRISPPNRPIYTSTESGRLYESNGVLISPVRSHPTLLIFHTASLHAEVTFHTCCALKLYITLSRLRIRYIHDYLMPFAYDRLRQHKPSCSISQPKI
jgi:hypothetical protein